MIHFHSALSLILLAAIQPAGGQAVPPERPPLETRLDRPVVDLLELVDSGEYSGSELKSMERNLERERDERIENSRKLEGAWKGELESARGELREIQRSPSPDTTEMAERRARLHERIASLEDSIRQHAKERTQAIPAAFETRLARLRVIQRWPGRKREVLERIENGSARERKHGDVEDIGYRKPVEGQEEDIPVGEQAVSQLMSSGRIREVVEDAGAQEYVRELGQRIARNSDLKTPLHLTVIESPEIRPITLPGGFIFLSSGLIRAASTETELAGVIAHEIARIATRQGTRPSRGRFISRMLMPAVQVVAGLFTGGVTNQGAQYGIGYGIQGVGMLVNRALPDGSANRLDEVDQLGIQYAWKSGFDPRGFISFLDSIPAAENSSKIADRIVDAFSEIFCLPPPETGYSAGSLEFRLVKERLSVPATTPSK